MSMQFDPNPAGADLEPIMDINTTPLIDVMLVLLVMLIITIPIQLHAVNLALPVGKPPPAPGKPEVVRIDIDPRSAVFWNGTALQDRADLKARLAAAAQQPVQPEVHLRPDGKSRYATFAEVMIDVNQAGLSKLGVLGSEQFDEP